LVVVMVVVEEFERAEEKGRGVRERGRRRGRVFFSPSSSRAREQTDDWSRFLLRPLRLAFPRALSSPSLGHDGVSLMSSIGNAGVREQKRTLGCSIGAPRVLPPLFSFPLTSISLSHLEIFSVEK
jgi:hypothetical protein